MYIYKFIWDINYYIMCVYTNINIYNISKKHVYLPIHEWLVEAKTSSKFKILSQMGVQSGDISPGTIRKRSPEKKCKQVVINGVVSPL